MFDAGGDVRTHRVDHVAVSYAVLFDWGDREEAAIIAGPQFSDSTGVGEEMFEQAEFAQQLRMLRLNLLGLEDRGAAWPRIHERHPPTLLAEHESGGGARQAGPDHDDIRRAML